MKIRTCHYLLVLVFGLSFSVKPLAAQVATGMPPYSSIGGGPADSINLANLNVHFSFPVLHKAGRGLPVNMDLTYDNTIWFPATDGVNIFWEPVLTGGWSDSMSNLGGTFFSAVVSGSTVFFCDFVYYDGQGTAHFFPGPNPNICPASSTSTYPVVVAATDGSGYQLTITGCTTTSTTATCSGFLNSREGYFITPPVNSANGVGSVRDRNGNAISEDASGSFTDTLGTVALKIAGTVTPTSPNPVTYTYTSPAGTAAAVTQSYKSHTVQTNFGCGIIEYGPQTASLVDRVTMPDGSFYQFTYEPTPGGSAGEVTGRLASIKLPTGGTISYTYTGVDCNDGTTFGMIRTTPDGQWTYQRSSPGGTQFTTTVTDPQGNQTVIQFQGIFETERQVFQGSTTTGTLLETTFTCYNGSASPCNTTAVTLPITQKSVIVQMGSRQAKKTYTYPADGSGVVLEEDDFDYGVGAPGALLKKTITTYASLGAIKSFPATVTVCAPGGTAASCNGSGTVIAQTINRYDEGTPTATTGTPQFSSVPTPRGNLTTSESLTQGTSLLTKHFSYFDTGNLETFTDINGAQTGYLYGTGSCGNSFPTTVNEPMGLNISLTWDCTGGVTTSITDENSQKSQYAYKDSFFWRPASTTDPTQAVTDYTYPSAVSGEVALTFNSGASTSDVLHTSDSLGRKLLEQRRQAPGSANFDTVEFFYDSRGNPSGSSVPYVGTAGQTGGKRATTSTIDALGRMLTTTDAGGGSTAYTYSQNDVLIVSGPAPSGENTKQRQLEYDGLGRLTSVCEITSAAGSGTCGQSVTHTGYWTKYAYDALGNLAGVTQNAQAAAAQQQTRAYAHDGLGRLTSETNPESGTTTYTYDSDATCGTSAGDKVKRTDAVGNTTCYAYDGRHRNTSITYTGPYAANTPNKYFVFDGASIATTPTATTMVNAKARLAEAYTATCPTCAKLSDIGYSYSARGEVTDIYQATTHSSGYYHLTEAYWADRVPSQLGGNTGVPTVNYGADGEGRSNSASTASQTLVSGAVFNAASQPTQLNLGTGDSDLYGYDPNTTRMTQYKFNVDSQAVVGNVTWNANATLQQLAIADPFNAANNQTCSYGYDDLRRVSTVGCAPPGSTTASTWQQSFLYDAFGNISKSGSMSFQPTYNDSSGHTNNKFTSVPGCTVSYDANGNVLNDCSHTYTWNAEDRPVSADGVSSTYDALSRMVEQNRSGTFTQIVYAPTGEKFALMNAQKVQKAYVPLPGKLTAVYTTTGFTYYRHKDWIGSSRFASTATLVSTSGMGSGTVNGMEQSKVTVPPASGTGSGTLSGTEQATSGGPGTPGTGSVSISGFERSTVRNPCAPRGNCPITTFDFGTITVTVNGVATSISYGQTSTAANLASALASSINSNTSSVVTASASSTTITLTAKQVGVATNYSLSASAAGGDPTVFPGSSFAATASGTTLTGGTNSTQKFDTGSVFVTVNGVQTSVTYGQSSTAATLASALVSAVNANSSVPVTAALSGSAVNLTAKTTGSGTDYSLSCGSSTSQPSLFSHASFTVTCSGTALTGGSNGTTTFDSGTVLITVNGIQVSAAYGQNDTSLAVAGRLAAAINAGTTVPAKATVSGNLILLASKTGGAATNYSLSSASSSSQPSIFSSPSFTVAVSGTALTGGSASAATMYSSTAYAPFGETYAQAGTPDVSFAGLNSDTATDLYDADAREYTTQGRFPSPDPAGTASMHLTDPQTLNRYAYSRNNPLSLADPSGKDWCDWLGICDGGLGGGGGIGCDWDPSCFGGSIPNPLGSLPDPFGLSTIPLPGTGCDWGCLDPNSGDGSGNGEGGGPSDDLLRANCFDKNLNDLYGKRYPDDQIDFEPDTGVPFHSQGGHLNSEATAYGIPDDIAQAIQQDAQDNCHWYQRGTKLPGGAHIPSCEVTVTPEADTAGYSDVSTTGHVDNGDVTKGPLGLIRHIGEDVIWGTLKQFFKWGDLDNRCTSTQ